MTAAASGKPLALDMQQSMVSCSGVERLGTPQLNHMSNDQVIRWRQYVVHLLREAGLESHAQSGLRTAPLHSSA